MASKMFDILTTFIEGRNVCMYNEMDSVIVPTFVKIQSVYATTKTGTITMILLHPSGYTETFSCSYGEFMDFVVEGKHHWESIAIELL